MPAISKWWLTCLAATLSVAAFAGPPFIRVPEIRRVLLSPDQVPAETERLQRGGLRSMSLGEFEDLLRRATQAESPRETPSLLAARYHCRWENGDLLGTANWTIRHSAREPGFLKLDPLSVAIRSARWSDDRAALIGDFGSRANGSKCTLIIDRPGDQQMNLIWSARGIREPNGARFDLRFPACAIAQIELELPADLEPIVSREEVLLSGPFADSTFDHKTWRIALASSERLDLTVASSRSRGDPGPLIWSSQRTRQEIDFVQVASEYTFDLQVLHGSVRHLEIDCDRAFQPASVTARNLDHWNIRAGTNRILMDWREPFTGGTVTIRGFSPTGRSGVWTSPGALIVGAVPRGETLIVQPAPDVRLVDFQTGSFFAAEAVHDRTAPITLRRGTIRRGDSRPSARIVQIGAVLPSDVRTPGGVAKEPDVELLNNSAGASSVVHLRPRNSNISSNGTCRVVISTDKVRVTHRLTIVPRDDAVESAVIYGRIELHPGSAWRLVTGEARLRPTKGVGAPCSLTAAIGGSAPWSAALNAVMIGDWQLVTFTQPINHAVELELQDEQPLAAEAAGLVAIPLFQLHGSEDTRWAITVDRRAAPEWDCECGGEQSYWKSADAEGRTLFSTTASKGPLRITRSDDAGRPWIDDARLLVDATQPGKLGHRLTLGVWHWAQRNFPIRLPPDAQNIAILIDGARVPVKTSLHEGDAVWLEVPVPVATGWRIEVRYILPSDAGQFYVRHNANLPHMSLRLPPLQVLWMLPADWEPAKRDHWLEELASDGRPPADANGRRWLAAEYGGEAIAIIRPGALELLGWTVAIAALLLSALVNAGAAGKAAVAAGMLLLVSAIWLPTPWPQFLGAPLVACAILLVRARLAHALGTLAIGPSIVRAAPAAVVIVGLWMSGEGSAAAPPPVVVYLLPNTSGRAEPISVLVPPQLPDLLRSAARRAAGFGHGTLIGADYDATVDGATVQITAKFQVYSSQHEPAEVALPLPATILREATVDGAPAFPTSIGDRTTVSVTGRGLHTLELKLTAECPDGDSRKFHLNIPELPSSHVSFRAPAGAKYLRTLLWRGAQRLSLDAGRPRLDADLGPVGALAVAWNREPPNVLSSVHVKEAYLWDMQALSARLLANVQFNVIAASSLSVDLPPDLEVTTVAARPQDASAAASPPPWLRDWTLSPAGVQRRLTLEFSAPMTGAWQVTWECIPRAPFASDFALRFPRAIGASATPAACAYRANGLEAAVTGITGLSEFSADEFLVTHWSTTRLEVDPLAPTRAYLRSASNSSAVVRLHAGAPKSPIANTPRSESTRTSKNQSGVPDDPKRPKPQATRDRLPSGSAVRISSVDVISAPAAEERQVYRLSAKVNASGPTNLTLTWPAAVEIAVIAFDSDVLMVSREKTTRLTIPIDERHRHGKLDCVWVTDSKRERPSMPRLESGGCQILPESTTRSLIIPPGRRLVAEPLVELVPAPSRTLSGGVRLPFDAVLSDRSAEIWSVAGDFPDMALAWDSESPRWPGRMIRTASLFALIVLVLLIRKLVGYLPLPEILASVALAGWIATGAWLWFVPLAFAVVMRATTVIASWRFGPQSAA